MIKAKLIIFPSEEGEEKVFVELPRKDEMVKLLDKLYAVKHIIHNLNTNEVSIMVKDIKHL